MSIENVPSQAQDRAKALAGEQTDSEFTVVGCCYGLHLLPVHDLADFYRGYAYVALLGATLLGLFLAFL